MGAIQPGLTFKVIRALGLAGPVKGSPEDYRELLAQAAWCSIHADQAPGY